MLLAQPLLLACLYFFLGFFYGVLFFFIFFFWLFSLLEQFCVQVLRLLGLSVVAVALLL